ncbi:NifB/NifX family molybdenum-iron cluster-binding protein [Clostridium coskatii]|uniref:Dinitrogenase iron-molybdenum cofactor n=1 Tax=Clostridium coskatii TaxID=1705578 RepID=A0A166TAR8_9CLOT|nr:NifB/NifX family molybdenum-iron cluster-binding protein [Clostridium coskatii]OAA93448.1 Dinitrogenase iron-molybdenum cofactor [Clostridium coskatii]OBR96237.1 dinitrogenase iron-molybdenum cofactor [Clostridium coskatii]
MKIALPNNGNMVNQHFGMSQSFVIVDVENNKIGNVEEVSTVQLAHQHEGLANLLVKHNVDLVITGGIGGGALMGLQQCGLKVIKGASGEYRDVVQSYIDGKLEDKNELCNHHCEH